MCERVKQNQLAAIPGSALAPGLTGYGIYNGLVRAYESYSVHEQEPR